MAARFCVQLIDATALHAHSLYVKIWGPIYKESEYFPKFVIMLSANRARGCFLHNLPETRNLEHFNKFLFIFV